MFFSRQKSDDSRAPELRKASEIKCKPKVLHNSTRHCRMAGRCGNNNNEHYSLIESRICRSFFFFHCELKHCGKMCECHVSLRLTTDGRRAGDLEEANKRSRGRASVPSVCLAAQRCLTVSSNSRAARSSRETILPVG